MRGALLLLCVPVFLFFAACQGDDDNSATQPHDDTESPVVRITAPADSELVMAGQVVIKARATDNREVEKVRFFADEVLIGEDQMGVLGSFDTRWNAAAGTHRLRAVAVDDAGNTGQDSICLLCAGPTRPVVTIVEPADHSENDPGTIRIQARATSDLEVVSVAFFDGEDSVGVDTEPEGDLYETDWNAETGWHSLRVVATDLLGNQGADTVWVQVGDVWQIPIADPATFCPDSTGTTIRFVCQVDCVVEIEAVLNASPSVRAIVLHEYLTAGAHSMIWDGMGDHGQRLAEGEYALGMTATYQGSTWILPASPVRLECP